MKKLIAILSIILCLVTVIGFSTVYASNDEYVVDENTESQLIEIKEKELKTLQDYQESYGTDWYGTIAYILHKVQIYSIPLTFIAIVIAAIHQYVIGIRKLDVRDKGFGLMIASITLLVICQVLPLVFAVVVKGWRG